MAEDEFDSFETAWNKYMGEQALMIQPLPEPSAAGNLLNQQESIAFSRFFDNLLAQPSSPRRTARRLDEELQRLSDMGQPYTTPADYANADAAASASRGYPPPPHQNQFNDAVSGPLRQQFSDKHDAYYVSQPAGQAAHGTVPQPYDNHQSSYLMQQGYPAPGFYNPPSTASLIPDNYSSIDSSMSSSMDSSLKEPKQSGYGGSPPLGDQPSTAQVNYTYASLTGMPPPSSDSYSTDSQLDPRFYPRPTYVDGLSAEPPKNALAQASGPSALPPSKRARTSTSQTPTEKRARAARGESQTRVNHMNSEKRRRAHIRDLFDRMCSLVPRVAQAEESLPKSLVLQETHNRLVELESTNARLRKMLDERGANTSSVPIITLDHPS